MTLAEISNQLLIFLNNAYLSDQEKQRIELKLIFGMSFGGLFYNDLDSTKLNYIGTTLQKLGLVDYYFNNGSHQVQITDKGIQLFEEHYDFLAFLQSELSRQEPGFHQRQNKYPNKPVITNQKESTIFQKNYDLSNHQVIGGLVLAGLLSLIAWYLSKK